MCHNKSDFSEDKTPFAKKENFPTSFEHIAKTYMPLIDGRASFFSQYGIDREELIQEGLLGLYSALKHYDEKKATEFKTFALHCINNKMLSCIRYFNANKSLPLKDYLSLSDDLCENIVVRNNLTSQDPQEIYVNNENYSSALTKIISALSPFEKDVFILYLNGFSYSDSAKTLKTSEKAVDNALVRVKHKLRKMTE